MGPAHKSKKQFSAWPYKPFFIDMYLLHDVLDEFLHVLSPHGTEEVQHSRIEHVVALPVVKERRHNRLKQVVPDLQQRSTKMLYLVNI